MEVSRAYGGQFVMALTKVNMLKVTIVLLFLVSVVTVHAARGITQMPSYIKPCSRSESDFNECALKHGREAISSICKGDAKYHIPSLNPLKLDKVSLQGGGSLKLFATQLQLVGIPDGELQDIDWNIDQRTIKLHIYFPVLRVLAQYNLDGRILIMNLKGSGPMNNSHVDTQISLDATYDVYNKNDTEFMNITSFNTTFTNRETHFHFENLLNNQQISDQMNAFINENWQIAAKEINPGINDVINTIISSIINPLTEKIPLVNILAP